MYTSWQVDSEPLDHREVPGDGLLPNFQASSDSEPGTFLQAKSGSYFHLYLSLVISFCAQAEVHLGV